MDKKGFLVGITMRQKYVCLQQLWKQKRVTAGLQDGLQEWITVLVPVYMDGSLLDLAVICKEKGKLCSGWVHNVEAGRHQVFFLTSLAEWSNDNVGLT
jgi:hypothetical protein